MPISVETGLRKEISLKKGFLGTEASPAGIYSLGVEGYRETQGKCGALSFIAFQSDVSVKGSGHDKGPGKPQPMPFPGELHRRIGDLDILSEDQFVVFRIDARAIVGNFNHETIVGLLHMDIDPVFAMIKSIF